MSINNRKYIQSTGSLLTRLNEESNNPSYQSQQQRQGSYQNVNNTNNNYNRSHQGPNQLYNQTQNSGYSNMPMYTNGSTSVHQQHNMYANNYNNQQNQQNTMFGGNIQVPPQAAAVAAQLISQIANKPDIMMMPGMNMPQQQQHQNHQQRNRQNKNNQQKNNQQHHGNYNNNNRDGKKSSLNQNNTQQKKAVLTSVSELPETFGLPSNNKKYGNQQQRQKQQNQEHGENKSQTEIVIDESKSISPKNNDETKTAETKSDDIEIISENYPENTKSDLIVSNVTSSGTQSKSTSDEAFKSYLGRTFNGQLAITPKPQCNFISNFTYINQLIIDSDYYTTRNRKPYSNVKLRSIYANNSGDEDSDNEGQNDEDGAPKCKKLKTKHVIVIDDTNEEMHKPWITQDLIKLIKHRNLLQSKLTESTAAQNAETADSVNPKAPDEELLKKFKNLRNKVTKLVKKARKDYLAKYIAESKENKIKSDSDNNLLAPDLASTLSQQAPPPPPVESTNTSVTTSTRENEVSKESNKKSESNSEEKTETTSLVNKITDSIKPEDKSSFLKNQKTLMMGLYNQYYNQYIQQYQTQQEEAQKLAQAAADIEKKKNDPDAEEDVATEAATNYELLKKQAAYYAKQQAAIQTQLETSLNQSAQQLIQEISQQAATEAQKPFVINQFSHQQQSHLHQHIHHNPATNMNSFNQQQYQPQPMSGAINTAPNYEPTQQIAPQQTSYNMHYNYNMVVS